MRSTSSILVSPVVILCGFVLLPVGNTEEISIYLWYILTGLKEKSVDAILGFTGIVFMLIHWIVYEFSRQLMMYRIYNFICGGLMLSSLILFKVYSQNHLGYYLIWPWSYVVAAILSLLIVYFLVVQVKWFYKHHD